MTDRAVLESYAFAATSSKFKLELFLRSYHLSYVKLGAEDVDQSSLQIKQRANLAGKARKQCRRACLVGSELGIVPPAFLGARLERRDTADTGKQEIDKQG